MHYALCLMHNCVCIWHMSHRTRVPTRKWLWEKCLTASFAGTSLQIYLKLSVYTSLGPNMIQKNVFFNQSINQSQCQVYYMTLMYLKNMKAKCWKIKQSYYSALWKRCVISHLNSVRKTEENMNPQVNRGHSHILVPPAKYLL